MISGNRQLSRILLHSVSAKPSTHRMASFSAEEDPVARDAESMVARRPHDKNRTRFHDWKKPVYVSPQPHPFEQSPDFSFKDGRPVHVTSQKQLNFKLEQIRIAKKIVSLLKETNEAEETHKQADGQREAQQAAEISRRPKAKGQLAIK